MADPSPTPEARVRSHGEIAFAIRAIAAVAAVLLAASLFQSLTHRAFGYTRLLDVDFEASAYTWLSSILIFCNALALLHVAWIRRSAGQARWRSWGVLGLVILGLSAEEILAIHKRFARKMEPVMDGRVAWSVPALGLCAVASLFAIAFVKALPPATRKLMLVAAGVYVGGAAGVECIQGLLALPTDGAPMILLQHLEEGSEVAGMLILLCATTGFIRDQA